MKSTIMKNRLALRLLLVGVSAGNITHAASITEPPTIFYGQVIGTGGAQPFVLSDGDLNWTIQRNDGSDLDIATILYPQNAGEISYRINIPHALDSAGLDPQVGIPMPPSGSTNEHARVMVNGVPAELIGPSGAYFEIGQQSRAATYRLDLRVDLAPVDTDGDGIPDWWEEKYNLYAGSADGDLDSDGDGISNLDEYLGGYDPTFDNRVPEMLTDKVLVYAEHLTGLQLKSADVNSSDTNVIYTLVGVPEVGRLALLPVDAEEESTLLEVGAQFTQADVTAGRLVFDLQGDVELAGTFDFKVLLQDEGNMPIEHDIAVALYELAAEDVWVGPTLALREEAYRKSLAQHQVVRDVAESLSAEELHVPEYSMGMQGHYFLSGKGDDELHGGAGNDTFVVRQGENSLAGGGGLDQFVFTKESTGLNHILDFVIAEDDVIDLSRKVSGHTGYAQEVIQLNPVDAGCQLIVDDLTVELAECVLTEMNLYDLLLNGQLRAGGLKLKPRYSVIAHDDQASEGGNNSAQFVIRRDGDLSRAQKVTISMEGVAQEGVDYASVGQEVEFPVGVREVDVTVSPFKDALSEGEEVVELVLKASEEYLLGSNKRATVYIKDLQAVVGVQVIDPLALSDTSLNGVILVTREDFINSSLIVFLDISGSAKNGSDYKRIPSYLSFAAGETMKVIEIEALPTVSLHNGAEGVTVAVRKNDLYALADISSGRITMLDRIDTLDAWKAREFPGSTLNSAEFAGHKGAKRITNLQRYAFGLGDGDDLDLSRMPKLVMRDGHMTVDIRRNPMARDVTFVVEVSEDLKTWVRDEQTVRRISVPEHADSVDRLTYQVVPLVEAVDNVFVRIIVEYTP